MQVDSSPPHQVLDFGVERQPAPAGALHGRREMGSSFRQASKPTVTTSCSPARPSPPLQSASAAHLWLPCHRCFTPLTAMRSTTAQHFEHPTCTPAALALNCFCSASSAPNSASIACSREPLGGSYSCGGNRQVCNVYCLCAVCLMEHRNNGVQHAHGARNLAASGAKGSKRPPRRRPFLALWTVKFVK